jgi:hypothetical protein
MLWRKPPRDIAKVGVEGSNPFARSNNLLKTLRKRGVQFGLPRRFAQNATQTSPRETGKIREARSIGVPVAAG